MTGRRHTGTGLPRQDRGGALLWLTVAAIGVFYVLTLRAGHTWGDDFAQYLYHARNIAEGRLFHESGYVRNTLNFIGPETYPPLTSILLAPVWYVFQLDLTAMKVVLIAVFCAALLAIGAVARGQLTGRYAVVLLLLFALNPYLWDMKDRIQSEYLYILASFLSLIVIHAYYTRPRELRSYGGALAIGVSIYLAWAAREIGIVLLPTLLVCELWYRRGLSRRFFVAAGLFVALALLQQQVLEPSLPAAAPAAPVQAIVQDMHAYDAGHLGLLNIRPRDLAFQAGRYLEALKDFWSRDHVLALFLFAGCSLLALAGLVRRLMAGVTVFEVYTAGYCALLLLFGGFQGIRYLVPVIPLYLLYTLHGIRWLEQLAGRRVGTLALGLLLCGALVVYADGYRGQDFDVIEDGIATPEAEDLLGYVREHTSPGDLIVFRKPRALYLLTGRRCMVYPDNQGRLYVVNDYLRATRPDYVITGHFQMDADVLIPAMALQPDDYREVYGNGVYTVYRYTGGAGGQGRDTGAGDLISTQGGR